MPVRRPAYSGPGVRSRQVAHYRPIAVLMLVRSWVSCGLRACKKVAYFGPGAYRNGPIVGLGIGPFAGLVGPCREAGVLRALLVGGGPIEALHL